MPTEKKSPKKLSQPPVPAQEAEAREVAQEYVDQQRAIIEDLRRKMN
jgi:hypothetical protein